MKISKASMIVILEMFSLTGCARYEGWEYVRIEQTLPENAGCVYKMQESCSKPSNSCIDWYKHRATRYAANTVLITNKENQQYSNRSGLTGNAKSGEYVTSIAEYYDCNGPKNIRSIPTP